MVAYSRVTITLALVALIGCNGGPASTPEDQPGYYNDTWTFDGSAWSSRPTTTAPSRRADAAMTYDAGHNVAVLFGGYPAAADANILADTWVWDGSVWSQVHPAVSPPARYGAAMVFDLARQVAILFGGWDGGAHLNDTWAWNGTVWTALHPHHSPPAARSQMAYDAASQVAVLNNGSQTWTWDGSDWTQHQVDSAPTGGAFAGMSEAIGGRGVILFGGGDCSPHPADFTPGPGIHIGPLATAWFWDGVKWAILRPRMTNSAGPSSPTPVCDPSVVYDAGRREIVVFGGGRDWCRTSDETWIWNGSEWTPPTLGKTAPDGRTGSSMAYDARRNVDVLFGGYDGGGCHIANLP
jgi:hypothetical protein